MAPDVAERINGNPVDTAEGLHQKGGVAVSKKRKKTGRRRNPGLAQERDQTGNKVTVRTVVDRLQFFSQQAAIYRHLACRVRDDFLGSDGVRAQLAVQNGNAVEPAREDTVRQVQQQLVELEKQARGKVRSIQQMALGELSADEAGIFPAGAVQGDRGDPARPTPSFGDGQAVDRKLARLSR